MAMTPMMQQYLDIKEKYKDCILFFRLGDFYEMFFEDAITASREMEVTLTGKNCGMEERAPMCGIPYHAVDTYLSRLVEKGYKVAICEQTEDPAAAKGIVKREVTRIVTPGTVISQAMLNEKENNYLASIYLDENGAGLAYCDVSTGEINATQITGADSDERLLNELVKIRAKEIIANEYITCQNFQEEIQRSTDAYISILNDGYYNPAAGEQHILTQFQVGALTGLGLDGQFNGISALGALLSYLFETQKQNLTHLSHLNVYDTGRQMSLDKATIKNLELTETLFEKKVQGSLLGVLDKTHTAMGSRKMKQWLREPLNSCRLIQQRLDAVELLFDQVLLRNDLKEAMKKIYDLERLSGRVACGNANGKDLIALRNSVYVIPEIKEELRNCGDTLLCQLEEQMEDLSGLCSLIDCAIVDEPPFSIKEGGLIRQGYSEELDEMKHSIRDGQAWIAGLEGTERERTGIKNLKVGFNKVFGYFIEVTKSNFDLVPENYIRKQTLVNCERFITPELKEVESVVLNAETKINDLEYQLFSQLREKIQQNIQLIQKTSAAIATLDVLVSFGEVSSRMGYTKPQISEETEILIEKGRHPVIEDSIKDGIFVSNDTYINGTDQSMLLITGPNMAGKSTYMRQTALIVLMAQAGCFVPAEKAQIGVVDRIYTRIGASDNLSQGQSTFFVEMSELAYILNTATPRSLVILDEIGRGTSTYDGLSIAWAVVEYLCRKNQHIRALFATHYHELTALEGHMDGVKNLNVDVQEQNGTIVFLHKIIEGSASRSYGIHVAKLAGVPSPVLSAAAEKLEELEESSASIRLEQYLTDPAHGLTACDRAEKHSTQSKNQLEEASLPVSEKVIEEQQLSFFQFVPNPVIKRLKELDLMSLTPSAAFSILEDLKKAAEQE